MHERLTQQATSVKQRRHPLLRFYGTLPSGWGEVDTWTQLQNLYLNDNNLTGTLPQVGGAGGSDHLLSFESW